ncbi:MAG: T9SS type A sorting domain-containing protein [Crocinitomix sp.]|nr:T9SS type A sorting domain-containing protein [Crocinitomix sp.]
MKLKLKWITALTLFLGFGLSTAWSQVTTFDYTGSMQTYVVPIGVISLEMELYGAAGYGNLGQGGRCQAELAVTPGETLNIYVGGTGGTTSGGYNGGGAPGSSTTYGGGGGASDVRQGGTALGNRIIVAGGGGGSGSNCGLWSAEGGHGGGLIGESGCLYSCSSCEYTGSGGSQVAAGIAGPTGHFNCTENSNGTLGSGGSNPGSTGTGGGGGYYGGGSGCYEGAGGGSSYTDGDAEAVVHEQGVRLGNGEIIITVLCTPLSLAPHDSELCFGDELVLDATSDLGGSISWDGGVTDGEGFEPPVGISTYTATSDADGDCGFSVEIEVLELPEVTASVDEEEICIGESIVLTGGGADGYVWFPLEIEDGEAYTPEVGEYTYTVVGTDDVTGCENIAEVDVVVYDLPEVIANISDDQICIGESVVLNGAGASSYDWDPAEADGVAFTPAAVGTFTYSVLGTDDNGCMNEDEVELTVYEELEITYTTIDEILGSDGEIDITVTGGNPAYSYDWDDDGTGDFDDDQDLTGLTGGTYIVVVMCDAGCSATETVTLGSQVGIGELNEVGLNVYPNPTTEFITVEFEGTFTYELTNINGAIIAQATATDKEVISLENVADGVYFVMIKSDDTIHTVKVVKK